MSLEVCFQSMIKDSKDCGGINFGSFRQELWLLTGDNLNSEVTCLFMSQSKLSLQCSSESYKTHAKREYPWHFKGSDIDKLTNPAEALITFNKSHLEILTGIVFRNKVMELGSNP